MLHLKTKIEHNEATTTKKVNCITVIILIIINLFSNAGREDWLFAVFVLFVCEGDVAVVKTTLSGNILEVAVVLASWLIELIFVLQW